MKEFIDAASLKEAPGKIPDQQGMIKELLKDHESVVVALRKGIDDCEDKFKDKVPLIFLPA